MQKKILIMLLPFVFAIFTFVPVSVVFAQSTSSATQATSSSGFDTMGIAIGAGLAVGLASLGAGLGIGTAGAAAISALTEKPETFFRSFLIVALAEALAIYGLIAFILLWIKI